MGDSDRIFFLLENLFIRDLLLFKYTTEHNKVFDNRFFRDLTSTKTIISYVIANYTPKDIQKINNNLSAIWNEPFFISSPLNELDIKRKASATFRYTPTNKKYVSAYLHYAMEKYGDKKIIKVLNEKLREFGFVIEREKNKNSL